MLRTPAATARSPQRRRADQQAVRQQAEQKRWRVPPRRALKRFVHQGHAVPPLGVGLDWAVSFVLVTDLRLIAYCGPDCTESTS